MKKEDSFKQFVNAFKSSCRVYLKEKERAAMIEAKFPELKTTVFSPDAFKIDLSDDYGRGNMELYQFLKDDIAFVEETFQKISEKCGSNAKVFIWSLYVENRIQTDVADSYGLTRRQLQYMVDKWLREVYEDE